MCTVFATPDIPLGQIAATDCDESGGSLDDENGQKYWTNFSGRSCTLFAVQNDPPKFLPKFLRLHHSISRCCQTKYHLHELLGLKGPNMSTTTRRCVASRPDILPSSPRGM